MFTSLAAIVTTMSLLQPSVDTDTDPPSAIASLQGAWAAVHVLPRDAQSQSDTFTKDTLSAAPTLAGVRHIFITPVADARAWGARLGVGEADAWSDASGQFAGVLATMPIKNSIAQTPPEPPVTFVISPSGEVLTRVSGVAGEFPRFGAIASSIEAARKAPLNEYNLPRGKTLAVDGYDVVAYFTDNKAVKGDESITSLYRGVTYRFATREHRALFAADPGKYAPTYGGWCASAMGAKGTKVEINPQYFKVKEGRLFLFYKDLFSNALVDWNKHEREWEPAADTNWKKLTGESAAQKTK